MRRRYVMAGFALIAATALVGTAVAGIGDTGDGPGAKEAAKKKGKRGPRGPAGPAGPPGPPGPPGSAAAFANAAAFAFDADANPIDDTFEDLLTANITTSATSVVIGTGSISVFQAAGMGSMEVDCRIEVDDQPEGASVTETLTDTGGNEVVAVTAGKASVPPGNHAVSIACEGDVAPGATFDRGNLTATATG